jgi:DNA invertase Pin-like site-specific DNA recombinase
MSDIKKFQNAILTIGKELKKVQNENKILKQKVDALTEENELVTVLKDTQIDPPRSRKRKQDQMEIETSEKEVSFTINAGSRRYRNDDSDNDEFSDEVATNDYVVESISDVKSIDDAKNNYAFLVKFQDYVKKSWIKYSHIGTFWHNTMDQMIIDYVENKMEPMYFNKTDKTNFTYNNGKILFTLDIYPFANKKITVKVESQLIDLLTKSNLKGIKKSIQLTLLESHKFRSIVNPTNPDAPIVWAYTRVSTKNQANEDGLSLSAQSASLQKYKETNLANYNVIKVEEIASARIANNTHKQYALRALIVDELIGRGDYFLVTRVDRLTRDREYGAKLFRIFTEKNINFVSVTEHLTNTHSYHIKTIFDLINAAQNESDELSNRYNNVKHLIAFYGYKVVENDGIKQRIEHPEEQRVINQIFIMSTGKNANGKVIGDALSYKQIANYFNANGLKKRGSAWSDGSIRSVISRWKHKYNKLQ